MICFDIGGWQAGVDCDSEAFRRALAARFGAFESPVDRVLEIAIRIDVAGSPASGTGPVPSLAEALPCFADQSGEECTLDVPGCSGRVDLRSGRATLTCERAIRFDEAEYFIRVVYALLAIRGDGLLVHAAGLQVNQAAYLFIGPSGSGKSTVVALSPNAVALNDDLVIVRPAERHWLAYPTPFWNLETYRQPDSRASVPIAGIYRLVQDRNTYLEPVSAATGVADLAANCPVVNGAPFWLPVLLARCRQLVSDVPISRLHFRKDPGFWDLIENRLTAGVESEPWS